MSIGQNIAKYRKEKGMTQQQLGEAVGVTNRTVSKWEADITAPGVDLIPLLSSALGITLDMLFGVETEKSKSEHSNEIKNAVTQALNEVLPDMLEETLDELLPAYLSDMKSGDGYSLVVISRNKKQVCLFKGQGCVCGGSPQGRPYLSIDYERDSIPVFYDSAAEASADLERIFNAYAQKLPKIEL